ncbi:hypothetical protein [Dongia sp.]|uniref:hypothetical protein n=1 Tax=Dongia sp. TaxID=1977262 RepID=UPI0035B25D54
MIETLVAMTMLVWVIALGLASALTAPAAAQSAAQPTGQPPATPLHRRRRGKARFSLQPHFSFLT